MIFGKANVTKGKAMRQKPDSLTKLWRYQLIQWLGSKFMGNEWRSETVLRNFESVYPRYAYCLVFQVMISFNFPGPQLSGRTKASGRRLLTFEPNLRSMTGVAIL